MYYYLFSQILSIIIALGLVNVWLVRFNRPTAYRGGQAQTLSQEFAAYGLPGWAVYAVGCLKVMIALVLLGSVCMPGVFGPVSVWALGLLAILMAGAVTMHYKVHDALKKFLPAAAMLVMTVLALCMALLA